ncbi:hypothetical protein [uncultured Alistipes sp.]|uniref:hypothetical protein n=1 Tax=uncultured Alistipes sp. TaxID=538949 RepID=UPI003209EF83
MKRNCVPVFLIAASLLCGPRIAAQDSLPPTTPRVGASYFPVAVQFTPVPSGNGWHDERPPLTDEIMRETVHNIILHGCTHIAAGEFSHGGANPSVFDYAHRLGMKVDYTSNGVQLFRRNAPPKYCVYSREYLDSVRTRIEPVLGHVKRIAAPYTIFPFMDEPFHADTTSFDYRDPVRKAFCKQYGYEMPRSYAEARLDPRKHLDFVNFQSLTFVEAWRKIYREVKAYDDRPLVVMTHDSHNTMGGGVESDSKWAVDDVFHWGGDFADMFIYDIYPYTMFDYRYGEYGKTPKPRISQMHYTLAQMRNLTTSYGKKLGFWLGTYNEGWFRRYLTREMREQYWMERELAYTAIAGGADYLITGINIPSDARHWEDFGRAMRTVQKVGGRILESPKPKARACFLFPRTQYVQLQEEYFNVGLTFELCLRAFGELDVIHEEQITDDTMNGYEILVLADVKMLPKEVAERIVRFVKRGGVVIADCVPQTDALMQPLETMKRLFGVESARTDRVVQKGQWNPFSMLPAQWAHGLKTPPPIPEKRFDKAAGEAFGVPQDFRVVTSRACVASDAGVVARMASGDPLLLSRREGTGRCYLFGFCLQDTYFQTWKENDVESRAGLQRLVHDVFADTGIRARAFSSNPDMEVALRCNDREAYVFVINHEAREAITEVELRDLGFEVGEILDVEWGRTVDFTQQDDGSVRFTILAVEGTPTGVTRLLKVSPKKQGNK